MIGISVELSRTIEEDQGFGGGTDLLRGESDGSVRVGTGPGMSPAEDGIEHYRRPIDAGGPLLPDDLGTDWRLLRDQPAMGETGPVDHVQFGSPDFDPGKGQTDGTILVRDERVLGTVEGQDGDRAGATQLKIHGHRGNRGDLSLMAAGIEDGESRAGREAGGEYLSLIDAVSAADLLQQSVHKCGIGALSTELPLGALGVGNGNQVAIG